MEYVEHFNLIRESDLMTWLLREYAEHLFLITDSFESVKENSTKLTRWEASFP